MDQLLAGRQSLGEALLNNGVVAVLGPEMLLVEIADAEGKVQTVPFYQVVAQELLRVYGTSLPDDVISDNTSGWLLHRAVARILEEDPELSVEKVRRSVSFTVKATAQRVQSSVLLTRLAKLKLFDLFICLTPDDCLVTALGEVLGKERIDVAAYAPKADSSQQADLPQARPDVVRVFFPLGRSATGTSPAIHEEDALEYFYKFQEEGVRRAPNLLTQLRSRDLLLLGCNLPDWLGRGFLRLANEMRLSSPEKKMEFFAADTRDPELNSFLSRFNRNATVFPWSPSEFVTELEAMVGERQPAPMTPRTAPAPAPAPRGASSPTVFVSYASEDKEAALRLAQSLAGLGFGDVWLDKRKLVAGDDWSDRIDEAIEGCDFFVPVLSRRADQRRVGVFWEEWRKAVMRAMRVNDTFLLPVGIDEKEPNDIAYERIFTGFTRDFRGLHLLHAPDGALSAADVEALRGQCERFKGASNG